MPHRRLHLLLRFIIATGLLTAVGSCAGVRGGAAGGPSADGVGPGLLHPPYAIGFDFAWRQSVRIGWQDPDGARRSESFEAVLQGRNGELQLVGLGPMERPAFVITQSVDGVRLENLSGRELPFDPAFMIADVQRVYFPWFDAATPPDVRDREVLEREGQVLDVLVSERWEGDALVERRFRSLEAARSGEIIVRYDGWGKGDAPRIATLENGWFGYELTVETSRQQRL